jgi:putative transposase
MPNYRRSYVAGGTYFLTIVTHRRVPLFADEENVTRLRRALVQTKHERPFDIDAAVILPDHIHLLLTLPCGESDYSTRVGRMKVLFTRSVSRPGALQSDCLSRAKHRDSNVWQRRFWEHSVRGEGEFEECLNYIHYNPVKHKFADCPHLWPHSSFQRWVRSGLYDVEWGCRCSGRMESMPRFAALDGLMGE